MTQKSANTKRLFFAWWPTSDEQAQFNEIALANATAGANRLVSPQKFHLTLSFLGSMTAVNENCVRKVADALGWHAFELEINRLGWFARPKVLWAGCSIIAPELTELVATLNEGIARCGIAIDPRAYRPHITLARKVANAPTQTKQNSVTCRFDEICLVESRSEDRGVRYTKLARWPARDKKN